MFWADEIAKEIQKRKLPLEWVDDMKTPSGRIHVGSLRGLVVHDLIYKCLLDLGIKATYSYVFDDHDPMDGLPVYLDQEKYEKYLGMPLFMVPSPEKGFNSYAEFFAEEFKMVFNTIDCKPEIIWASELYGSGKMNDAIRECLDKADSIKKIYEKMYKKKLPDKWYPFQPYCTNCGKVSTTTVTDWDGENVAFTCDVEKVKFTKGCGFSGKMSPFSSNGKVVGKLPWKVEWPAKWKVIGITVEGAGKDHMSAGGSHDIAEQVCKKVLNYPVPYPFAYEWFILGKKKMSTSKGVGASAIDMLNILPPVLLRFLMVRTRINSEINFDLDNPQIIPALFDEYQKCADAYFNKTDEDLARIFALSQIGKPVKPPSVRFSVLAQWVQMPNMESEIKKQNLDVWVPYVKNWLKNYAPDSEKFFVQENLPPVATNLSQEQKEFLKGINNLLDKNIMDAEKFQFDIYELSKKLKLKSADAFAAVYLSLIGKTHGPKAAWLILSVDKTFAQNRFAEAASDEMKVHQEQNEEAKTLTLFHKPEIFSIDEKVAQAFPSISIGVAVIKGVHIAKENKELQKEIDDLLSNFSSVTTEQLGEYEEVQSYRKLYKEMGVDWHSRRPSPEALLRRVILGKGLYNVNTCVDAYNAVVMNNRVSVGAFDLDNVQFPTVLRFAKNNEEILLLSDEKPTAYAEKEVAYFDAKGGYNMDFNYRDAQRTAVQLETKNILINVDGVYDITPAQVEKTLKEACDIIMKYCGGELVEYGIVLPQIKSMTRDEAYSLLTTHMQNKNLIKHCLAAEVAMRGIYKHLHANDFAKETQEMWGITGLLHDVDYEVAQKENKLDKHGILLFERDPNFIPEPMARAIKSHNYHSTGVHPESDLDYAITCVDG
ncbi:MAG: lysine--tRNA ligase, partial [Candidatus Levyibacteriota bacterium]